MSDLDGSGTIEFDEYVRVMATYCMFTKDEILRFCFECFDVDKSGTIDEKEFVELCKYVLLLCFPRSHFRLHSDYLLLFVVVLFLFLLLGVLIMPRQHSRATLRRL